MSAPEDIDTLIEQFQKSGLRELHVRVDDWELYLSTDSGHPGINSSSGTPPRAAGSATPVAARRASESQSHRIASEEPAHTRSSPPTPEPASSAAPVWPPDATIVRAPYLGTFYRAPKPGAPAYVEVDGRVAAETELCMVEVMKLFTAVRAGIAGQVQAILAKDGELVQAQQPLFVLVPFK